MKWQLGCDVLPASCVEVPVASEWKYWSYLKVYSFLLQVGCYLDMEIQFFLLANTDEVKEVSTVL